MVGVKVKHASLGIGTVTDFSGGFVTIEFATKTSKFEYPDAFEKFIAAEDNDLQAKILQEIKDKKESAIQKRMAEEAARKAALELLAANNRKTSSVKRTSTPKKEVVRTQRIEGKRMTFYVFQGGTFEKEYNGGYIWAPKADRGGSPPHHWTRLLDVRKGDIILHGSNGYVQAISVAKDTCYDCPQPVELEVEELWDRDGRRIDCDYIYIKNPIKTSACRDDIIRLCSVKYAPFDKDGNGNMGYLYELPRELARIFVRESAKANPHLYSVDYIAELLAEEEI